MNQETYKKRLIAAREKQAQAHESWVQAVFNDSYAESQRLRDVLCEANQELQTLLSYEPASRCQ